MKKILLIFLFFTIVTANAQLIFQDDFSGYSVGQELSGQGSWSNSPTAPNVGIGACLPPSASETCSGAKILSQPLSYLNYGSSANSLEIAPVKDGVAKAILPVVTNGDFYLGMVLNLTTAPTAAGLPVDFIRVLNSDQTLVTFRVLVKDAGFGYNIGIRKGGSSNATVYTNDLYNYGESVLLIIKYSHLDGINDDVVSAFVNPNYIEGEPFTPSAITASGFDQSGAIDRIAFRQNYNVLASMPTGFAGLVSTSSTWNGLTFLPLAVNQFESNNFSILGQLENGFINITSKNKIDNAVLNVFSMTGSLLESKKVVIESGNSTIPITSKLSSGVYIVQFIEASGSKYSYKLISK